MAKGKASTSDWLDEAPAAEHPAPESGERWRAMDEMTDREQSGIPVILTQDGVHGHVAVWRRTRAFQDGRFEQVGFWAVRNAGGQRIPWEPVGWREFHE